MDSSSSSSSSESSSSQQGGSRKIKEDYRIKYAYLDYLSTPDLRGLISLANDVHLNMEILKNSYLAIVNSLVILNERRRKRELESNSALTGQDSMLQANSSNFINAKVANNFRNSNQESLSSYPELYEWNIDKFCDPETRDVEFDYLFKEADDYVSRVHSIEKSRQKIDINCFQYLVKLGKSLIGIIELLNNNYSNNFLDIFRLS